MSQTDKYLIKSDMHIHLIRQNIFINYSSDGLNNEGSLMECNIRCFRKSADSSEVTSHCDANDKITSCQVMKFTEEKYTPIITINIPSNVQRCTAVRSSILMYQ